MKEKMLDALKNENINDDEKRYIIAVASYIDECMRLYDSQNMSFQSIIDKMIEIVRDVNNCNTGIEYIDNIIELRKKNTALIIDDERYLRDLEYQTSAYIYGNIRDYISFIADFGGLFKYVCDKYKKEIEKDSPKIM